MNIPIVPPAAFASLAGDALLERVTELRKRGDLTELVLFSDPAGAQLALVAVGPGKRFARLADAEGVEIDGLRALCAMRPGENAPAPGGKTREQHDWEASLEARERYVAECEQRMAEVGQALSEREAMLEQREHLLLEKERDFFRRGGEIDIVGAPPHEDAKSDA